MRISQRRVPSGQGGEALQQFAEIVRVRINGQQIRLERQPEVVGYGEIAVAGRNVQRAIVLQLHQHRKLRRRLDGEIQSRPRAARVPACRWDAGARSGRGRCRDRDATTCRQAPPRACRPASRTGSGCRDRRCPSRSPGPCRRSPRRGSSRDSAGIANGPPADWRDAPHAHCPAGSRWPSPGGFRAPPAESTKFQKTSGPEAGTTNGLSAVRTRSGGPSCHPGVKTGGGGASAAAPSGAPARTHCPMVSICWPVSRRSPTKSP